MTITKLNQLFSPNFGPLYQCSTWQSGSDHVDGTDTDIERLVRRYYSLDPLIVIF